MSLHPYISDSITLLKRMVSTPSYSREEKDVADIIEAFWEEKGLKANRKGNNLWIKSSRFTKERPTVLLNSHIDTVRPSAGWNYDPFSATVEGDKITGLGSNDAGASVVALLAAFRYLEEKEQPCNFIFSATAEEEISGDGGIASILDELGPVSLGVVGEPTMMHMAVAEKGLMVIDGLVEGKGGHAARNEGVNAIYKALPIIEWFKTHSFPKMSEFLGPVKMTVTGVEAGSQHNMVPDNCRIMIDVRVNEFYKNRELFDLIQKSVECKLKARSFRLNSSFITIDHPIVKKGEQLGLEKYGSPTTSDQARMPFTTIKIGPGDSARSHTPNEYIYCSEIVKGVDIYLNLLNDLYINAV